MALISIQARVILQDIDLPLNAIHIIADIGFSLLNQPGNMPVPGNHRGEIILQRHQLIDVCTQGAVGSIGGAAGP